MDGQVHAGHWPPALDDGTYPAGVKISDHQIEALPLTKHDFHGDWNYTIAPG